MKPLVAASPEGVLQVELQSVTLNVTWGARRGTTCNGSRTLEPGVVCFSQGFFHRTLLRWILWCFRPPCQEGIFRMVGLRWISWTRVTDASTRACLVRCVSGLECLGVPVSHHTDLPAQSGHPAGCASTEGSRAGSRFSSPQGCTTLQRCAKSLHRPEEVKQEQCFSFRQATGEVVRGQPRDPLAQDTTPTRQKSPIHRDGCTPHTAQHNTPLQHMCTCMRTHVTLHAYTHTQIHSDTPTGTHIYMYNCAFIFTYRVIHIHVHMHVYFCAHVHTQTYTHTHMHTYTERHTRTHTYT